MYAKPYFSAGQRVSVQCRTSGSRPAAHIAWFKEGQLMEGSKDVIDRNGIWTISTLVFTPSSDDNGKYISCQAINPNFANFTCEDGWNLNVHYKPEVFVSLEASRPSEKLHEGDNILLECRFHSNPSVTGILWYFEDELLASNSTAGIFVRNQSVEITSAQRRHNGKYICVAENAEGRSTSNGFQLNIKYAPRCKDGQKTTYSVSLNEAVQITCEVEADPTTVKFLWHFNNSVESRDILSVKTDGLVSSARYVHRQHDDFGVLTCRGENSVGVQKKPCQYNLIPVGPPDPVQACNVSNCSSGSFVLECSSGDDGGLPQSFHLEVYRSESNVLLANLTRLSNPVFQVTSLPAGESFYLIVYAANAKGQSQGVRTTVKIPLSAKRQLGKFSSSGLRPLLGVLVGTVASLVLVAIIIVIIIRMRGMEAQPNGKGDHSSRMSFHQYDKPLEEEPNCHEISEFQNRFNTKDLDTRSGDCFATEDSHNFQYTDPYYPRLMTPPMAVRLRVSAESQPSDEKTLIKDGDMTWTVKSESFRINIDDIEPYISTINYSQVNHQDGYKTSTPV
ncbi:nephrin-like [Tachypleus tridentatus]|uniref:nephrin-like n=1 Tax=Tachypleus tridentatus TaxID=6853 RepID=UPI003FCFB4C5